MVLGLAAVAAIQAIALAYLALLAARERAAERNGNRGRRYGAVDASSRPTTKDSDS